MKTGQLQRRAHATAAQIDTMTDRDHSIPFVIEQAPSWCKINAYADYDHSIRSLRSWYSLIMWPLRALCVALLLITQRVSVFGLVIASIITIVVIYMTR